MKKFYVVFFALVANLAALTNPSNAQTTVLALSCVVSVHCIGPYNSLRGNSTGGNGFASVAGFVRPGDAMAEAAILLI
jgi:hypothetical protein